MTGSAPATGGDACPPVRLPVPQVAIGIPAPARELIWKSFFIESGRGTVFERHLPWHADLAVRSIFMTDGMRADATAIIRPAPQAGVAMIGYVCVVPSLRGQGYGRALMRKLNDVVDALGYRAAVLWTGKPEVYAGQGYRTVGRDRFVTVAHRDEGDLERTAVSTVAWPQADVANGLPAFATHAYRHWSDQAMAIVACGPQGVTLLDWQGDPGDIAILLGAAGYARWSVNIGPSDDFVQRLATKRLAVSSKDGAFAMVRCADRAFVPAHVPQSNRI